MNKTIIKRYIKLPKKEYHEQKIAYYMHKIVYHQKQLENINKNMQPTKKVENKEK